MAAPILDAHSTAIDVNMLDLVSIRVFFKSQDTTSIKTKRATVVDAKGWSKKR